MFCGTWGNFKETGIINNIKRHFRHLIDFFGIFY